MLILEVSYRLQVNIYIHVSFVFNIRLCLCACGFPCFFLCECFTYFFCSLVNVLQDFFVRVLSLKFPCVLDFSKIYITKLSISY